jgi:hypothetical protein
VRVVRRAHPCCRAAVRNDLWRGVDVALVERGQRRSGEIQRSAINQLRVALKVLRKEAVRAKLCADGDAPANGQPSPDTTANRQPRITCDTDLEGK